jgi:predicted transcriptional regulator
MTVGVTMAVRKVTVSIDASLLATVDRLARRAKQSRSQWLAAAAVRTMRQMRLQAAVAAALDEAGGPVTPTERAQALRDLGLINPDADAAE